MMQAIDQATAVRFHAPVPRRISRCELAAAGERWYVVQTHIHSEARAVSHLERQEFPAFCPFTRKVVRHARKSAAVRAPLFPGYCFVKLDLSRDPWRSINGTIGVTRIVCYGTMPSALPAGLVEELKARADNDNTIDWNAGLTEGQKVRIAAGPFTDQIGTLQHLDARGRAKVLLDLLGRHVAVAVRGDTLIPAA